MPFEFQLGDKYRIELDAKNEILRAALIAPDGERPVRFSQTDPSLGGFLTWLAQLPEKRRRGIEGLKAFPSGGNFITDVGHLVDECKSHGWLLTTWPRDMREPPFDFRVELDHFGQAATFGLSLAAAAECDPEMRFHRLAFNVPSVSALGPAVFTQWVYVSAEVLGYLDQDTTTENSDASNLLDRPVRRTFVYIDISDFSKLIPTDQVHAISALGRILRMDKFSTGMGVDRNSGAPSLESSICIGDGYILTYRDAHEAAFTACLIASIIEELSSRGRIVDLHFRIAVNTGEVLRFWDDAPAGVSRWNYVGEGITNAQRVLDAMGKDQDDVVYLSASTRQSARRSRRNDTNRIDDYLTNRGRREDKQRKMHRIYEANHTAWTSHAFQPTVWSWLELRGW